MLGMDRIGLRGRVIATTVLGILVTTGVVLGSQSMVQDLYRSAHQEAYLDGGANLWNGLIENQQTAMASEFDALTRNRKLTAALFKGDASAVGDAVGPTYTRLTGQGTIDDLAVVSNDGAALYASYENAKPQTLDLVQKGLKTKKRTSGLVADAHGRILNAVVIPLYDRADFVGVGVYLKGLNTVAQQFKKASGRNVYTLGTGGNLQTTTQEPSFAPDQIAGNARDRYYGYRGVEDRTLAVAATPLRGHNGQVLGRLITAEDRTEAVNAINRTQLYAIAIGVAMVGAILIGVWIFFSRAFGILPRLVACLEAMGQGDFSQTLHTRARSDELGRLVNAYNDMRDKVGTMVGRVREAANSVTDHVEETTSASAAVQDAAQRQQAELSQVATAMNESSSTIQEVARNTSNASDAAEEANEEAKNGHTVVTTVIDRFDGLAQQVNNAAGVVDQLQGDSEQVGEVLTIINGIAEQTNLLALNAAIEAARAGEQGRGFAVVAEEVRTLAQRTQDSVSQIRETIDRLQSRTQEANSVMATSQEEARGSMEYANEAGKALQTIVERVGTITDQMQQIASATEEQSQATEQVDRTVTNVTAMADETADKTRRMVDATQAIGEQAEALQRLTAKFQTEA